MPETNPKPHGGARTNAGRKKGSSVYGESTQVVRVPESLVPTVINLLEYRKLAFGRLPENRADILYPAAMPSIMSLPLFAGKVSAGFPSPADDFIEKTLDLNELLVQKPAATFFVRAQGESMLGAGIHPNDILVVDRSIEAAPGKIVICALNGELTVKRLEQIKGQWTLQAENPSFADIVIHEGLELVIWGVVTNVIHPL
jgi:DNA polymerase V